MKIYLVTPDDGNNEDFNLEYCPLYSDIDLAKQDVLDSALDDHDPTEIAKMVWKFEKKNRYHRLKLGKDYVDVPLIAEYEVLTSCTPIKRGKPRPPIVLQAVSPIDFLKGS